jgi:NDP-sugar pyrophosphorylase family protein
MLPIMILAGGLATRLYPITEKIPKSMIPVNGAPFIYWQMKLLEEAGFDKFILCVSHKSQEIKNYLKDGSKFGVEVIYSEDGEKLLGTGGAILKATRFVDEKFAVLYGDSYLPLDYKLAERYFLEINKPAMMTIFKNDNIFDQSNVLYVNHSIVEYKKKLNDDYKHIDYGLSFFTKSVFQKYPTETNFDLAEVCENLAENAELAGYEVFERFYEIGSLQGIQDLETHLKENPNGFH